MELFKLVGKIAIENSDAMEAIEDTTDKAEDSSNKMVSAFKKIGGAVVAFLAVDKIKDFGLACVNAAADANAMNSQFSQVFGDLEDSASDSLAAIAEQAGITENRMKGSFTKIAAFAKTTGMETEDALELSERAMVAVADSAAFYDRSLEETTESLQSFLKGNYENDAALGLSCTEITRNAAANELYGKSFQELSESQKQLTLLKMVEDANKASGALGQAARESDTWTNQTGNLKQAWKDFEAIIGATLLPMMVDLVAGLAEKIQGASEAIAAFSQWCSEHETILSILGVVVGTITTAIVAYNVAINAATIATKLHAAATTIATTTASAFGAVLAFITSPITLVIAAIGALIAIGVALYKNWAEVKAKCAEFAANIKEKFQSIRESVSNAITLAKEKVLNTFNSMKNGISQILQSIVNVVKKPVNVIIGVINGLTSGIIGGINGLISALNRLKIDVPDWVTDLTGIKTFGFNLKTLSVSQIPYLEKGGVLEKGQVGLLEGSGAEAVVPLERNSAWISRVAEDMRTQGVGGGVDSSKMVVDVLNEILEAIQNLNASEIIQVVPDSSGIFELVKKESRKNAALGKPGIVV